MALTGHDRVAGKAVGNNLTFNSVFLGGEGEAHRGDCEELSIRDELGVQCWGPAKCLTSVM